MIRTSLISIAAVVMMTGIFTSTTAALHALPAAALYRIA